MTNREAVNWLINISADIGKAEHRDLWHYEQALYEIREMLEDAPEINVGSNKRTETQRKNVWHNTYNDGFPAEGDQVLVTDGKYFWLDESVANDVGLMWEGDGSTCWERTEWAYLKDLYVG